MDSRVLSMKGVCKGFNGVKVLNNIDFDLKKGEVHALVGENGAGKSTLMKILTGVYSLDRGDIFLDGEKVFIDSPKKAKNLGITIVHQELSLISSLTVMENIYFGSEFLTKIGMIDYRKMENAAREILSQLEADFSCKIPVNKLTVANKQIVEIAKALSIQAKVLVLDEPTSSLTQREVERLFKIIDKLKKQGVSIVYISHHMDEIFALSDRVTILRDGEKVFTGDTINVTEAQVIKYMVGRDIQRTLNDDKGFINDSDEAILEIKNLSIRNRLKDISFILRKGEILGFAGLVGAGRTELARAIFGIDSYEEGEILYKGNRVKFKNTEEAAAAGIGYIPEERRKEGLLLKTELFKNLTLKYIDKNFFIDIHREKQLAHEMINKLKVKCQNIYQPIRELSGGNQQKVIIAKWLSVKPEVLILDEPTRGIDINAKYEIYRLIKELAQEGVAIMLISSEMSEILALSHRIQVMHEGRLVKEFTAEQATQEQIMYYAVGGQRDRGEGSFGKGKI